MIELEERVVHELRALLADANTSLPRKYRALFALRNVQGDAARSALAAGLADDSALLRHEVAYCLGQRQDPASVQLLKDTLANPNEHPMVRHEAAEALGAIATDECLVPLQQHQHDSCLEVAETCQLALQRIENDRQRRGGAPACAAASTPAARDNASAPPAATCNGHDDAHMVNGTENTHGQHEKDQETKYLSVDPAFAAPASTPVAALRAMLLDEQQCMSQRYAAMFALRNKGGEEAVQALGDAFGCRSALLKHEVAYVLGQMQDPAAVEVLKKVLRAQEENAMVRHEAAEALGSIASDECVGMLQEFARDSEPIVAHSCEIALDMLAFEQAGGFDYMDVATLLKEVPPV